MAPSTDPLQDPYRKRLYLQAAHLDFSFEDLQEEVIFQLSGLSLQTDFERNPCIWATLTGNQWLSSTTPPDPSEFLVSHICAIERHPATLRFVLVRLYKIEQAFRTLYIQNLDSATMPDPAILQNPDHALTRDRRLQEVLDNNPQVWLRTRAGRVSHDDTRPRGFVATDSLLLERISIVTPDSVSRLPSSNPFSMRPWSPEAYLMTTSGLLLV